MPRPNSCGSHPPVRHRSNLTHLELLLIAVFGPPVDASSPDAAAMPDAAPSPDAGAARKATRRLLSNNHLKPFALHAELTRFKAFFRGGPVREACGTCSPAMAAKSSALSSCGLSAPHHQSSFR